MTNEEATLFLYALAWIAGIVMFGLSCGLLLFWLLTKDTVDYGKEMDKELEKGIRPPDPSRHSGYYD